MAGDYHGSTDKSREKTPDPFILPPLFFPWETYDELTGNDTGDLDYFKYGYDDVGNREWKGNLVAGSLGAPVHLDEDYHYDDVYRLIGTDRGNLSGGAIASSTFDQDWTLDSLGNWSEFVEDADGAGLGQQPVTETREHNLANELTEIDESPTNVGHDAVGNMTTMPKPSNPASAITAKYDAWNGLVEVSDGGVLVAKFRYDGEGRRILKAINEDLDAQNQLDSFEHFFLNGQQVVESRENTSDTAPESMNLKHQQIWSPRYIDALILRDDDNAAGGDLGQTGSGLDRRVYYLADANHNVTALVNTAGNAVERYVYDPYGNVTVYDDDWSDTVQDPTATYDNTTLYTGREVDWETGLYYYRARYYHAGLGRFVSRDPIGYGGDGVNLYRYCGSNPLWGTDPQGKLFLTTTVACFVGTVIWGEVCAAHMDAVDQDWGGQLLTQTQANCINDAIAMVGQTSSDDLGEAGVTASYWERYRVGTAIPGNCPTTDIKFGCGERIYLPPMDIDCTTCSGFVSLMAILIHENRHASEEHTDEVDAYTHEIAEMRAVRTNCNSLVADGICANVAQCRQAVDQEIADATAFLNQLLRQRR